MNHTIFHTFYMGPCTHGFFMGEKLVVIVVQWHVLFTVHNCFVASLVAHTHSHSLSCTALAAGISGGSTTITSPSVKAGQVGGDSSGVHEVLNDTTRKREVRLMKNRSVHVYTVKNGSLLKHNTVSLLGQVSKIVSILLTKLAIVPILTHRCATVTTHF